MGTFIFAFYLQFNNLDETVESSIWLQDCQAKFVNCSKLMKNETLLNNETQIPNACVEFFTQCTTEGPEENPFNDWKVMFKTLSMAAGELAYDDLPFEEGPFQVLTFMIFTILVLFVIMNLMTSIAVNDIGEIRNKSRDSTWMKLMNTLMWYDSVLPDWIIRLITKKPSKDKENHIIEYKLNEPITWKNFLTRMPDSVSTKAKIEVNFGKAPKSEFTIVHNIPQLEKIIILNGKENNYETIILKRGEVKTLPYKMWKRKFAFVDYMHGYDCNRKTYAGQQFKVYENYSLEIFFEDKMFKLKDRLTGEECLETFRVNYENVSPSSEVLEILTHYGIRKSKIMTTSV